MDAIFSRKLETMKRKEKEEDDSEVLQKWSIREKMNRMEVRNSELRAELEEVLNPTKCCFHRLYDGFRCVTFLSSFFLLVGQLIIISFQQVPAIHYVLRCYVILACTLICFNELECTCTTLIHNSAVLRMWISRGLFYSFVGILSLAENDIHNLKKISSDAYDVLIDQSDFNDDSIDYIARNNTTAISGHIIAKHYVTVVSWLTISCGILYFLMGALCIGVIVERLQVYYEQRRQRAEQSRELTGLTDRTEKYHKINTNDDDDADGGGDGDDYVL